LLRVLKSVNKTCVGVTLVVTIVESIKRLTLQGFAALLTTVAPCENLLGK